MGRWVQSAINAIGPGEGMCPISERYPMGTIMSTIVVLDSFNCFRAKMREVSDSLPRHLRKRISFVAILATHP